METNNKHIQIVQTKKLDDKEYTFVFDTSEETMHRKFAFRTKLWQIFPVICGSTVFISFGLMLGWPSPMYPILLDNNATVLDRAISYDESAMIAGFLMIGNTLGTPISSTRYIGAKYGVLLGATLMLAGWIAMWQARDIYWLLISRLLVGAGNGYGIGRLKHYITEICEEQLSKFLIKQIALYIFFGVILAFVLGPFTDFRKFGISGVIIAIVLLFLGIFLPSTPRELLKSGKVSDAKKLITFLSPSINVDNEVVRIRQNINHPKDDLNWLQLFKTRELHKNFALFGMLVFFQQFTGIPATIVYSQIIFTKTGCQFPEFCALLYSVIYFFTNIFGIFWTPEWNKRRVLILSNIGVCLILIIHILILIFEINEYWNYISLIVMLAYNIVHTLGLGNISFSLIPDLFPSNSRVVIGHFFIMAHSMFALVITKIFQVLMTKCDFYVPFCLFLIISSISLIFNVIFLPTNKTKAQG